MTIETHVPLAPLTYFRIGGPAAYFTKVSSIDDLTQAITFARQKNVPYIVISGGSNILVSDDGFSGLVIRTEFKHVYADLHNVVAGAGVPMALVVNEARKHALQGIEWAIGIPGMVGGSVRGNAGCFGGDIKKVVDRVIAFNVDTGEEEDFTNDECAFDYRTSMFKFHPELIITEAIFRLSPGSKEEITKNIAAITTSRIAKQDIGTQCAGCIFKNPNSDISAGKLIDEAGLKGAHEGGAKVSMRHANFIVSDGTASASDVRRLIERVKNQVKKRSNIELEEEIQYIGAF